jgi:ATP-dependent helicase/DNAse subunit B
MRQLDGTLKLPEASEIEEIANVILSDYLKEVCPFPPELLSSRLLHLFTRLRKLAVRMLCDMISELRVSRFVPARFEHVIGMPGPDGLPPFVIPLNNGSRVLLTGKVDRIDFFEKDGKTVFRIVDYKSGKHEFSLKDVKTGMEIQLVLYLFAVLASDPEHLQAAGAQYLFSANVSGHAEIQRSGFLIDDPEIRSAADASEGAVYTKKLISRTAEEIEALAEEMKCAVTSVAQRILSGEAEKTPSEKACQFCPVRMHCDKAYHE